MAQRTLISAIAAATTERDGQKFHTWTASVSEGKKPYAAFSDSQADFAAVTEAAFHLAGLVRRSSEKAAAERVAANPKHGGLALWKALVGPTAYGTWRDSNPPRIDEKSGSITTAGLNVLNARVKGETRTHRTTVEAVTAMAKAMSDGGIYKKTAGKSKGAAVKMGAKVTISRAIAAKKATTSKASSKAKQKVADLTPKSK